MGQEVREYHSGSGNGTMPAGTNHVQVYITGGGGNGSNGDGSDGGCGGGGGAFACFDCISTAASTYSYVVGGPGQQSSFSHVVDNQLTTGQNTAWAGGSSGQTGSSSWGLSGYGPGQLMYQHKGGNGANHQADSGGGGGGGGRVIIDGGDGYGTFGSGLGGGNGSTSHDTPNGSNGSANTGGGGGGGYNNGSGGQGASGCIRVTITTA